MNKSNRPEPKKDNCACDVCKEKINSFSFSQALMSGDVLCDFCRKKVKKDKEKLKKV